MVSSKVYPDLERAPGKNDNWVERAGGLPDYIERVAKHIHYEGGKDISTAISMAISQIKKWAAQGKAKAVKALAEWEALKGKNAAKSAIKMSAQRIQLARRGPYTIHKRHTEQFGHKKGDLSKPADWQHPYQPRTQTAGALKAKHIRASDLDSSGKPKPGKSDDVKQALPASAALQGVGRKEQHTGDENQKTAPPKSAKTAEKTPSTAVLQAQRRRLEAKVTAGTATTAEKATLNRVISQLKKVTSN